MWHMPGHIYWRLDRFTDSAYMQEASARTDHLRMLRDHVLPYQIHNYAHNNEWLCRSLINVGRMRDAVELAKNMIEQPRHPSLNALSSAGSSAHYGRARLWEALHRYELWDDTLALCEGAYLEPTDLFDEQVKRLRALGRAHLGRGDLPRSEAVIADLQKQLDDLRAQQDKAGQEAEQKAQSTTPAADQKSPAAKRDGRQDKPPSKADSPAALGKATAAKGDKTADKAKNDPKVEKARTDARRPFDAKITQLVSALDDLQGRRAFQQGRSDEGLKLLEKAGGVPKDQLAFFYSLAGQHDKAVQLAQQAKNSGRNEVLPLAAHALVLFRAGRKDEA